MLFTLVILALAAFAGAVFAYMAGYPNAVPVHLALAGGALPLVTGAVLHFVPVLTRSAPRRSLVRHLPWLMLLAGLLVIASFLFPLPTAPVRDVAATLGIVGAASLAWWIIRLSRKSLGGPHPGVYWYLAALGCLMLALASVLAMHLWPGQYVALRRVHLHLNTIGFIGITAIGTLQVLLPTALGVPDPGAARRLRDDLKWSVAGTLLIASGAAWFVPLVWPGVLLWLVPLLRLAWAWWSLYRKAPLKWNGNATAIAGALLGFTVILALGVFHALGTRPASQAGVAYLFAFLLPLVIGAAGYLLPLWVRPGVQSPWHASARQALARFGAVRVALFIGAGVMVAWGSTRWGWVPAAGGLMLFAVQLRTLVLR